MTDTPKNLRAALLYAELGWQVIPLQLHSGPAMHLQAGRQMRARGKAPAEQERS